MAELHSIGPFILGDVLGEGTTGLVKLGFHKDNGFKVAVKIINKAHLSADPRTLAKVRREIAVLKFLDHPNIMKLYDVYETHDYLFLITEYLPKGELFDYIISRGILDPAEALRFFQMLVEGVDYCHSHYICHRDLKPENLLLDENKNLKIADFGMAAVIEPGSLLETSCGSPHYASPEVVRGEHYNGLISDTWSVGVILFALTSGRLPFDDENIRLLLGKVRLGKYEMPPYIPKAAQDLIARLLVVDPQKRMRLKDVKQHPYFRGNGFALQYKQIPDMPPADLYNEVLDDEIVCTLEEMYMQSKSVIISWLTQPGPNYKKAYYLQFKREKEIAEREDRYDKIVSREPKMRQRARSTVAPSPFIRPKPQPLQQRQQPQPQQQTSCSGHDSSPLKQEWHDKVQSVSRTDRSVSSPETQKDDRAAKAAAESAEVQMTDEASIQKKEHASKRDKETIRLAHTSAKPKEIHHASPQQPVVCSVAQRHNEKYMTRVRRASVATPNKTGFVGRSDAQIDTYEAEHPGRKSVRPGERESMAAQTGEKSIPKKKFWASFFKVFTKSSPKKESKRHSGENQMLEEVATNAAIPVIMAELPQAFKAAGVECLKCSDESFICSAEDTFFNTNVVSGADTTAIVKYLFESGSKKKYHELIKHVTNELMKDRI